MKIRTKVHLLWHGTIFVVHIIYSSKIQMKKMMLKIIFVGHFMVEYAVILATDNTQKC